MNPGWQENINQRKKPLAERGSVGALAEVTKGFCLMPIVTRVSRARQPGRAVILLFGASLLGLVIHFVQATPWPATAHAESSSIRERALGERVLRRGHWGADVFHLQRLLMSAGYLQEATGIFGPLTQSALKVFQKTHGLAADGFAGPATIAALRRLVEGSGSASTDLYTVRPGDTLWHIAQSRGTTMEHLIELNGLTDATLHPGQKLRVPKA